MLSYIDLYFTITLYSILIKGSCCDNSDKVCQCINQSGTNGNDWGTLKIASNESRLWGTDCILIYITATPDEIVELRFNEILLRKGCKDQLHIISHLKEPLVSLTTQPDEIICAENSTNFSLTVKEHMKHYESQSDYFHYINDEQYEGENVENEKSGELVELAKASTVANNQRESTLFRKDKNEQKHLTMATFSSPTDKLKEFQVNRMSVYSSGNVLAVRIVYEQISNVSASNYFRLNGSFRFLDKSLFKIDGNLLPTTLCDYQFLPHPINYAQENKYGNAQWRYFHSPRYPAKYSGHVKCAYKFIGRPTEIVEVVFKDVFFQNNGKNCINLSDKITIYDNKINDKSSVIDVYCTTKQYKKTTSTGPNLLIEFESSGNRTANGFSGKYRFVNVADLNKTNNSMEHFTKTSISKNVIITTVRQKTLVGFITELPLVNTIQPTIADNSTTLCTSGANCDIVLHSSTTRNGTIQSPLFPGPYPIRSFCRYEFLGEGKQRIQVKFVEFTLPSEGDGDDCEQADTLQILMPIRGRYEPVDTLCGDTLPKPIMSNGPRMLFEFRGRQSGKGNRGFKAEFIFLENFGIISGQQMPEYECSFLYNSSIATSGWFHSPNFPGAYPRNIECNYFFHGKPMERVFVRFTYFDVEGIFPCDEDSSSDSVELSNFISIDRKFEKYCSKNQGFSVRSDGKFFRITFRSNDRLDGTGFRASYVFETEKPTTETTLSVIVSDARQLSISKSWDIFRFMRNRSRQIFSISDTIFSRFYILLFICLHHFWSIFVFS